MNLFAIALMGLGLTNASGDLVMRRLQSQECGVGELPLDETMGCSLNGYTCVKGRDGPRCCDGRRKETRVCVPCDETRLKKPEGTVYTNKGSCSYDKCGVGELHLDETMGCSLNGYTCVKGRDGPQCCGGRRKETRECVPCDETRLKKPAGTMYNDKGSCSYSECGVGELPLDETMGCSINGYTCVKGRDGPQCCDGRRKETRVCVPCDETRLQKPAGTMYTDKGSCSYSECGVGELPLDETMGCSINGYTCVKGLDGPRCCDGRRKDTRMCIPCDETRLQKPAGTIYTDKGSCSSGCGVGELPLDETMGCSLNGYTCVKGRDGPQCCSGRRKETRVCVPCDETRLRKPAGAVYTDEGKCSHSAKFDIGSCDHLELTEDGNCVATKVYGNNHNCEITVLGDFDLDVRDWEVEAHHQCRYDYLKLPSGKKFCNNSPQGESVSNGDKLEWSTDRSVTRDGWEICAGSRRRQVVDLP